MPLNPPSYSGQDVWYSPNVYINQVQAALWQPAVPMPSALHSIPVLPNPSYSLTAEQISLATSSTFTQWTIRDADGNITFVPADTPGASPEGTAPSPGAAAGQISGPTTTAIDPVAVGQGGYSTFIANMTKAYQEGLSGAWRGGASNSNIQKMLAATGISSGSVFPPGHSFWCAAFMGWMLKISGLKYVVGPGDTCSASAPSYVNYGQSIDIKNPKLWRQGDVAVVGSHGNTSSGSHVTFLWSYPGGGWWKCLGGNQGNTPGDLILGGFQLDSFRYIGRAWPDPNTPLPTSPSK